MRNEHTVSGKEKTFSSDVRLQGHSDEAWTYSTGTFPGDTLDTEDLLRGEKKGEKVPRKCIFKEDDVFIQCQGIC